jgi:hypothetical protein
MPEAQPFLFMNSFPVVEFVVVSNSLRHLPAARGLADASRVKNNGGELGDNRRTNGGP